MNKIKPETVNHWRSTISAWLEANYPNYTIETIRMGSDAWAVAHRAGVLNEAYTDRTVADAHIQTALEQIFPNVTFKDAKRYGKALV